MKKTIVAIIALAFIGSGLLYAQNKKPVFFGVISCGDNLEKCITNGWVQHTGGETAWLSYDWKLIDSNITSRFPRAGVVFDSKNIIQEIHLISTNLNSGKPKDDTKGAFNYMLQYFCQRYSGMKKRDVYEREGECLYNVGTEYYWETPYIHIRLRHFTLAHNENMCTSKPVCFNYSILGGTYAEVIITRK